MQYGQGPGQGGQGSGMQGAGAQGAQGGLLRMADVGIEIVGSCIVGCVG